ncbi:MAG: thiamine pyrophosphate-binding protein [Chloroflexota bacterium]|nr:thiamine pyrophosphate-binding protein [Chloroflexota bacterium]MEC9271878.1 thiamine pyrophosphate-binding protein [Chloroflexota bacterium]MEC9446721.1 thiamine pyrophosphate-binding protein [Chloroflexota bacterium]MED5404500.1 thiamine pyrophosphate-binding protein [Chloroflexota bacterium]MEE3246873.1 thiamine pyrophosphate-binding protein [Chloroflexota bacterium]|tara:strand:+ start:1475 stop:3145 length:1671 start_codon:yes stop_codon:yes gene_type:complete
MAQIMTGKQAVLEMLKAEGVKHIFGNPGTSEAPLIDMLGDYPELQYFLTLQESVAMGMGESYARATEKPSFVSLHVDSGLANGIALMLDALNTGTPMVITSANYDARKINETKTDLAELVRPVTKWSVELNLPDQIPSVMRRAFHEANSHPKGPVYVGFTANALEAEAEMNIVPSSKMHDSYRPDPKGIEEAVKLIMAAKEPLMMVGDRVSEDHANDMAVELAELMGFPVHQSRGAEVSFPTTHPQFFGNHTLRVTSSRKALEGVDLVLAIGMDAMDELFYWGDIILGENTKLVHIDPIPGRAGRSEPTDVGIVSHCGLAIEELIRSLKPLITPELANEIEGRKIGVVAAAADKRKAFEDSVTAKWDNKPMSPARMMSELADALPDNAIVVDDSISNRATMRHYFQGQKRGDLRAFRGQSIGGGIGTTMGTAVANPDRPVFGIIGDGSAMMTIQGLWTAANDNIPCIFVICNNGMYRVLKVNFDVYQREILQQKESSGENLPYSDFPTPFDVSSIASSMGVHGERITDPAEIAPAVQRAVASGKPAVLDIVIDGSF